MRCCENVKELAQELGVHRSVLYSWRDQLAPQERAEWQDREQAESRLERENRALKQALAEEDAHAALRAAGLVPLRRIGERMWLVESPPGLESLELANRLQDEARFDFVQPNWWQPKTTK